MNPVLDVQKKKDFLIIGLGLIILLVISTSVLAAPNVRLDLFIEIKAPERVEPGEEYTVNVSYGNSNSAVTPEDTWVEVTLPAGIQFVSAEDKHHNPMPPDSIIGNLVHWDVGRPLPDWQTERINIVLAVDTNMSEYNELTVSAEIGSSSDEVSFDNNMASVTSYTCDMAGSGKRPHTTAIMPADEITYTISIVLAEGSSQGFRDVTMVDTLPPAEQARFLGWTSEEEGSYDGSHLQWQGRVHAGQSVKLQYRLGIEGDIPSDTALSNSARLTWWDGEAGVEREFVLKPVTVTVSLPEDAVMIGPEGGQWQYSSGITLTVPISAVQEITRFQFKPLFEDEMPDPGPPGWMFAHRAFEMQAFQFGEIHQFDAPLEIALHYNNQDVAGLIRNTLRIWYRSSPNTPWEIADEPTFHQDGLFKFETDHFTEFALFAHGINQVYLPMVDGQ